MNRIRHNRLTPTLLLATALLLRAVIPAGYMPAAAGGGLLFEFCPAGIPADFVQFLAGGIGQYHGHGAHGDSAHHDHDGHGDHQCPVGHMLLSAATVDDTWQFAVANLATAPSAIRLYSYFEVSQLHYRPRGPPS